MTSFGDELFAVDVQKRGGLQANLARGGLALPQSPPGASRKTEIVDGAEKKRRGLEFDVDGRGGGGGGRTEAKSRSRPTSQEL